MLQLLGRWATKINITSKSEDVQLGYSIWNLTKTLEVLLFVTWLKMGDCEESKDDRTGANHCDNNLKSSRHDIFPIMLPKMSTLWRTVRKWFAENLKGRFKRCSSCQMQYSPQLGEKGSPCRGDGSQLAGPSRHPRCSKNGYSWPVDCLKFAVAIRESGVCLHRVVGPGKREQWPEPPGLMTSWLTKTPGQAKTKGLSLHGLRVPRRLGWSFGCCDLTSS